MENKKIKTIALANGDVYENCKLEEKAGDVLALIKERGFISVSCGKQKLLINSEFIVSIEI